MPVNGTCLGYEALVNSTTLNRSNGIAKTWAFCLRRAVHEMFIVVIMANTMHDMVSFTLAGLNYLTPFHIF